MSDGKADIMKRIAEKYPGPVPRTPAVFADGIATWIVLRGYRGVNDVVGITGELGQQPGEIVVTLPSADLEPLAREAWIHVAPMGTLLTIKIANQKGVK